MAQFQKYPVYQYDEPATYDDFRGGINLEPSSDDIADNELRDCVNMEYSHVSLKKRKGAKVLCRLISTETLNFIQGITIFTKNIPFIVVAADGKLYYSLYVKGVDINLKRLYIYDAPTILDSSDRVCGQFNGLPRYSYLREEDYDSEGYVYVKEGFSDTLYFQNKHKIEFASYKNNLYVATGTRIVIITVNSNGVDLSATCTPPYIPNGIEYQLYGENFMSPYPYECLKSADGASAAIKNIVFYPNTGVTLSSTQGSGIKEAITCRSIMIYPNGKRYNDYYFKWEVFDYSREDGYKWRTLKTYRSSKTDNATSTTKDNSQITILRAEGSDDKIDNTSDNTFYVHTATLSDVVDGTSLDNIKIRCSFAGSLNEDVEATEDFTAIQIDGSDFGQFQISVNLSAINNTETTWRTIQTCKKILADGNKFILYDDAYNSGEWFKTVIDKPNYIVNKGCLNFKTGKNEQIIKVVHFKGVLVVFSHNGIVGGNISIVSGNGDDDAADNSYSPYTRRVVNSEITCDCPESIQIAENILFFKFRDTVYAIEGSDISSEIISLYSLNDKLKSKNSTVLIPWEEDCTSEITSEFYSLIWKEKISYDNGEAYVSRPAMRLKMYYKIGQEIDGKVFFPWLRDESTAFNTDAIIYIDGISTHLKDMDLIQYNDEQYLDCDEPYDSYVKLKAYDLNYPKISKFIRNVILCYHRADFGEIEINTTITNEAGHALIDSSCSKASIQDLQSVSDKTSFSGKLGATLSDNKVYSPKYMFPLLQAATNILIKSQGPFVLNSITFNYYTTDVPYTNQYDSYSKIIKRSTPIKRVGKINVENTLEIEKDNTDRKDSGESLNIMSSLEALVRTTVEKIAIGDKQVHTEASQNKFPAVGDTEALYLDTTTNILYHWDEERKEYVKSSESTSPIQNSSILNLFR